MRKLLVAMGETIQRGGRLQTLRFLGVMGNITTEQSFLSLDCFEESENDGKALRRMMITILQPVMFFFLYAVYWTVVKILTRGTAK